MCFFIGSAVKSLLVTCMVHVKDVHEVPDAASVRSSRFAGENMTILADVGTGIID